MTTYTIDQPTRERAEQRQRQIAALMPRVNEARGLLPNGDAMLRKIEDAVISGEPDRIGGALDQAQHWIDSYRSDQYERIATEIAQRSLQDEIRQSLDPQLRRRAEQASAAHTVAEQAFRTAQSDLAAHERLPSLTPERARLLVELRALVEGHTQAVQAAARERDLAQSAIHAAIARICQERQAAANRAYDQALSARERALQAHAEAGYKLASEHDGRVGDAQRKAEALRRAWGGA